MSKKPFEAVKEVQGTLVIQLKDNQRTLLREVSEGCDYLKPLSGYASPLEKKRNRIESRSCGVFDIRHCLIESHEWKENVVCAIRVSRHTEILNTKTRAVGDTIRNGLLPV